MNKNYDYDLFSKEMEKNINEQNTINNKNVVKALKDTKEVIDSMNQLNNKELNIFFNILFTSLTTSYINNKKGSV